MEVLRGGTVVDTYTLADLRTAVGSHPAYFGNPDGALAGQDAQEPFAFVNFFDLTGYFDQIRIFEAPLIGGYESDNHTVGHLDPIQVSGNAIPEPASLALFGFGLLGCILDRRQSESARSMSRSYTTDRSDRPGWTRDPPATRQNVLIRVFF